jgi:hypothetical protein
VRKVERRETEDNERNGDKVKKGVRGDKIEEKKEGRITKR